MMLCRNRTDADFLPIILEVNIGVSQARPYLAQNVAEKYQHEANSGSANAHQHK